MTQRFLAQLSVPFHPTMPTTNTRPMQIRLISTPEGGFLTIEGIARDRSDIRLLNVHLTYLI